MLYLFIFMYAYIGGIYFEHNKQMGHWLPGIIVSLLWIGVAIMWIIGARLVHNEHIDMEKRMKLDKENHK